MFFSSKNTPNGPAVSNLKSYSIDLSGSILSFDMPDGNSFDKPDPQGSILDTVNIYESSISSDKNSDSTVIADRWFSYKGFLGEKLGSVNLMLRLYHLDKSNTNLFSKNDFTSYLNQYHTEHFKQWNNEADESCQILAPDTYTDIIKNEVEFSHYKIFEQQSTIIRSLYSAPVSDDCYVEYMFRHIGVKDSNATWLAMANELENTIISSVNLKLTESAKSAKTSAA